MGNKIKTQHYVPKMYIKRFSSDNQRICVWKLKDNNILTRQRPDNFAAKNYFYNANEFELKQALQEMLEVYPDYAKNLNLQDEEFIEKGLSKAEADASNILDLICNNHEEIYNDTTLAKFIIFVHDLAYRNETYRNQLDNINIT